MAVGWVSPITSGTGGCLSSCDSIPGAGSATDAHRPKPTLRAFAAWLVLSLWPLDGAWLRSLFLLHWVLFFGVIAVAELAAPLLWGFQKYRWTWLNGWSAAAVALAVGAGLGFAFGSMPVVQGIEPQLVDRFAVAALVGPPAMVVAVTIRLISFRTAIS